VASDAQRTHRQQLLVRRSFPEAEPGARAERFGTPRRSPSVYKFCSLTYTEK
jgi:hypothetical protein